MRNFRCVLLGLCIGAAGCAERQTPADAAVKVAVVSNAVVDAKVVANGELRYADKVELTSEIIGRVAKILVEPGQAVKKGSVILLLEQAEIQATIDQQIAQVRRDEARVSQARNALVHEESKLARQLELANKGFASPGSLDDVKFLVTQAQFAVSEAESALAYSRAVLSSAREKLAKTEVRAPMDGTVMSVDIRVGETAIPSTQSFSGASLMTIADPATLFLAAKVGEAHIDNLKLGQRVTVWLPNANAAPVRGLVAQIPLMPAKQRGAPATQNGYFDVSISLEKTDAVLRPGYNCRGEIHLGEQRTRIVVPVEAIQTDATTGAKGSNGKYSVWVLNGNVAQSRTVTLGISDEHSQEVLSGLQPGEQVVVGPVSALSNLKSGATVKLKTNA